LSISRIMALILGPKGPKNQAPDLGWAGQG
jgi:hypothetical protein